MERPVSQAMSHRAVLRRGKMRQLVNWFVRAESDPNDNCLSFGQVQIAVVGIAFEYDVARTPAEALSSSIP
jgi:hypothetical protein